MKTYNNLFSKIVDKENIMQAIEKAANKKRKKRAVQHALANKEKVAERLSVALSSKTWRPASIHNVNVINDGIKLKKREIVCPEFVNEQCIHHAIFRVCGPLIAKKFYFYSCASISNKGREMAISYITKKLRNKKAKYYCLLDVKSFFSSLRPSVVFHELRKIIKDKQTLMLFAKILRGNKVRMPDGIIKKAGVPIGFYSSPWFANIALNPLDHALKENFNIFVVVRYMDDILLLHPNKRKLTKAVDYIVRYLNEHGLKLKHRPAIHLTRNRKFTYIGAKFGVEKAEIASATYLRARRSIKRIVNKERVTIYDARKLLSYAGQFKTVKMRGTFKMLLGKDISLRKLRKRISKSAKRGSKGVNHEVEQI